MQLPQLAGSRCVLAQYRVPPVSVQVISPIAHEVAQVPPEHTSPVPHACPHMPQ